MPSTRSTPASRSSAALLQQGANLAARIGPAWIVVFAALALSLLGIYSIDLAEGLRPAPADAILGLSRSAISQLVYLVVGLVVGVAVALPDYRRYGEASWFLMALVSGLLVFLILPFVPPSIVRPRFGARSWIDFGPASLQPSELAKLGYVLLLAWYLRFAKNHRSIKGLLPPAIITGIPVALIMLQPDLGTACLFIPTLFAVLVAAGAKLKHLGLIVLIAAGAAPAAYPLLRPHQKERIQGLFEQIRGNTASSQGINYQPLTAQRLIGSGGVTGLTDERARTLTQYNDLPEARNDMIFSIICNRFGLLGAVVVFALYLVWIAGAVWVSARCREPFGRLVVVGFIGFLLTQVIINVGMNVGLLPIIGITLPFVSQGGSSMLTVWTTVGLIVSIAAREPNLTLRRSFEYPD